MKAARNPRRFVGRAAEHLLNPSMAIRTYVPIHVNLGVYDAAIIGGGVAGVVCAAKLASRGLQVVLLEGSGSLLTEITCARRTLWALKALPEAGTAFGKLVQELMESGAYRDGQLERVLPQLATGHYIQLSGTHVLFEAVCQEIVPDEKGNSLVNVVLKNGTGILQPKQTVTFPGGTEAAYTQPLSQELPPN